MADSEQLWELVGLVRSKSPLVQCLTNYVSMDLMANGLLALTAGVHEACRLIPPLIVNDEDLDEGLAIFADAVKTVADRHGVSNGAPKPHTTGRPAVLRGLTGGSSFDGA